MKVSNLAKVEWLFSQVYLTLKPMLFPLSRWGRDMSEFMAAWILRVSLISLLVLIKKLSNETISFIQRSSAPWGFICFPILLVTARTLFPATAVKSLGCWQVSQRGIWGPELSAHLSDSRPERVPIVHSCIKSLMAHLKIKKQVVNASPLGLQKGQHTQPPTLPHTQLFLNWRKWALPLKRINICEFSLFL